MDKAVERRNSFLSSTSVSNTIIAIAVLAVLAASFHRLFYGVEITDEANYVAEARLVAQGGIPFVNNWFHSPGYVTLFFWLVPLFESLSGGTEGLLLFMRISFWGFRFFALGVVFFILRKRINIALLLLFLLPFVPFSPGNINMFSYNTIPFFLLLIGQAIMIRFANDDSNLRLANKLAIWAGIILALVCLAHPSITVLILYYFVLMIAVKVCRRESLTPVFIFVLSGLAVGGIVATVLSISGGGFSNLVNGIITGVLDNPYFRIEKAPISDAFARVIGEIKQQFIIMLVSALVFIFGAFCRVYSAKSRRCIPHEQEIKLVVIWVFLVIVVLYVILLVLNYIPTDRIAYSDVECALFPVPLALLFFLPERHKRIGSTLILSFWIPCMIILATNAFTSWSGLYARFPLLYGGAMLSIIFFYLALDGQEKRTGNVPLIGATALSLVLILNACVQPYMFLYREAPFKKLEYLVEYGVYKGLHTTKERGDALIALEMELRAITSEGDDVLFMEAVPMAYLMTNSSFCTPTTWDAMQYSYGFKDDRIMRKYFQAVGRVPNKIIYIDTGRDEVLSIETDNYSFNTFVNDNYELTYERTEQPFRIKMYELVDSLGAQFVTVHYNAGFLHPCFE